MSTGRRAGADRETSAWGAVHFAGGSLADRVRLYEVPLRRVLVPGWDVSDAIDAASTPRPIEVVRPEDLVHLTFSFVNLMIRRAEAGQPELVRRNQKRPAFLLVDFGSQHVGEEALFETAV